MRHTPLFFFADLGKLDGGGLWKEDEGAETPVAARFNDFHVIFGRADFLAGCIEEIELNANAEPLRV